MLGVDVHGSKGAIAWPRVRAGGVRFVYLKATEGLTFDDERFVWNRAAAKAAGLQVGAYHFARPDNNPARQEAEHFLRVARPRAGELLPVLDWETGPPTGDWAVEWLRIVGEAIGARPVLYSYGDFLRRTGHADVLGRYPLWLANYGPNDGQRHPATAPTGYRLVAHQYTSRGSVSGIAGDVDLNFGASDAIAGLVYDPDPVADWSGPLDFYAEGKRVASGSLRGALGRITSEGTTWIRAVREAGGFGRVEPHLPTTVAAPVGRAALSPEPPSHPEGEGYAGVSLTKGGA